MKAMSIIGVILFSLLLVGMIVASGDNDQELASMLGVYAILYGIPLSIVGIVKSTRKKQKVDVTQELLTLNMLKEKGALSEEEFNEKKLELLKK